MQGLVGACRQAAQRGRAMALGKRYQQLEWEAKLLGLNRCRAGKCAGGVGAYVLIVVGGRTERRRTKGAA